jgi:hypothetical protein
MRTSDINKICARWVPKEFRDEHKQTCMESTCNFLQQYHEREAFLQQVVTGNKTQVHHYKHASKCKSVE